MHKTEHHQCRDSNASLPEIISCIRDGHNILLFMRGVPGSGKSYTARKLNELSTDGQIFSTDDYFYSNGVYKWDANYLDEYHKKNVARVRDAIRNNTKLVIVDNTNIQVDHMRPYAHHAIKNFYEIYVVEPESEWKDKVKICAQKNIHGVTKETISNLMDLMSLQKYITLNTLIGKHAQIKLSWDSELESATCSDLSELFHPPEYPKPISFSPPPGLPTPGISAGINLLSSPAIENILNKCFFNSPTITKSPKGSMPVFEKGFLSLSHLDAEPTERIVEQRTVQTQFSEVMVTLAETGIPSNTLEFLDCERTVRVVPKDFEPERKERAAPFRSESDELEPNNDMDILVALFPFENAEDLKHYYDNVGMAMTIELFHETGNAFVNHDANVVKGAYQPHEELREPMNKPFRSEKSEFSQLSVTDDVKVQVKFSDLKTILSILFGTGDGDDIPEYATVNISVLLQLYKQSKDFGDPSIEFDEDYARKLNEENYSPKPSEITTMAQRIQFLNLVRDYPTVDSRAMYDLFVDNELNSEFTRAILNAQFDPPTRTEAPISIIPPRKPLQRRVIATTSDFNVARERAQELFKAAQELQSLVNEQMTKGQKPPKLGGTYYRAEALEHRKESERLRNEANEILKQANLRSDVMDFHHMTVSCALETLKEKLKQHDRSTGNRSFQSKKKITVITGAGKSYGSKALIRTEVIGYLNKHKYSYFFENEGQLTVNCK